MNPPAIRFRRVTKKETSKDDDDESSRKKLSIRLDPTDEDSDELQIYATIFGSGTAEEWVKWRVQFDELVRDMPLTTGEKKIKVAKALLKGEARDSFVAILTDIELDGEEQYPADGDPQEN